MSVTRRGFFSALAGVAALPVAALLPKAKPISGIARSALCDDIDVRVMREHDLRYAPNARDLIERDLENYFARGIDEMFVRGAH